MTLQMDKAAKQEKGKEPYQAANTNPPSTYERASYISRLFCLYVVPFLYRHYKRDFDLGAIEENAHSHQCQLLGEQLKVHWRQEVVHNRAGKSANILRALFKTFWGVYLQMNFWNFLVYGVFRMVMPLILGKIIHYSNLHIEEIAKEVTTNSTVDGYLSHQQGTFANSSSILEQWLPLSNRQNVLLYSVLLGALVLINILVSHPYFMLKWRLGMRIRIALTRLVYEKALCISNQTVQRNTVGRITNLIANDAARFDSVFIYAEFIYMSLLETPVAMVFLYIYIGRASLGALVIILFYLPFQTIMANILAKFRSKSIRLTDNRLKLMSELMKAMRIVKMYTWERPFSLLVHTARKLEIAKIRQSMMFRCLNLALFFVSSKVISFVCILLFLLDGGKLNAEIVFVALALINQIRDVMTYQFPQAVAYSSDTYISLKRIEKFLLELDIEEEHQKLTSAKGPEEGDGDIKISLKNVSVILDEAEVLKNISLEALPGKLTTIIGPVGSGKSSVLLSILNEMPTSPQSQIKVNGKLIYVSQESWITNDTIMANVLFGMKYDPERYRDVIKYAALQADLKQFENGDQTMVDDRGTSLSGGQRARISLARALYTDADVILLDDPLSAVDAAVAKFIFEKCIKGYLRNKCVILVTHQLQFIKQADQIVVLKDGACFASGSYIELLNKGIDLFRFTATATAAQETPQSEHSPQGSLSSRQRSIRRRIESFTGRHSRSSSYIESDIESIYDDVSLRDYTQIDGGTQPNQTSLEMATTGDRSERKTSILHIYWIYIRAGAGIVLFSTFFLSNCFCQLVFTGTDYWLSQWTSYQEELHIHSSTANYTVHRNPIVAEEMHANIIIYSVIVIVLFCFSIIRTVSYFTICMRASVKFHRQVFASLIQAPIKFFDQTAIGIIMNRVSRDVNIIDDQIPPIGFEALEILGNSLGIFILCTALNYFIVVPLLAVIIVVIFAQKFYVDTARKLKRLEGSARSPLFSMLSKTLSGLTTIRCYGSQPSFIDRFSETQDRHTATFFTFISASRFYGIFLEFVCIFYIYCLMIALNVQLDDYSGSIIGLTISQSLLLCNSFNWGVRQYTEVETMMTSVERIDEFRKIDRENTEECSQEPPESWPNAGDIIFDDVSLAYDGIGDDPPQLVLRDLSFHIRASEKIGICGRTGAGKSSLITTLFRLTQPTGCIRIDGIDTDTISLTRLRKSIAIIPQEPILFSGDIRHNLDPFNERTDAELWDAIEKVQLKAKIQSFPAKLNSPVSDCGSDFSVGQKQLVCLARAILRKNRILVLDEASANVDLRTDSLIQNTIRTEFASCTVLTIAHRLNTIIDCDRVIVLDAGSLVQFDTPFNLIKAGEGIFYELYDNINQDAKNELLRAAEKAYLEKHHH